MLGGQQTPLHLAHEVHVFRGIMKQMSVDIICHGDRRVPQHGLDLLRRPTLLNGGVAAIWRRAGSEELGALNLSRLGDHWYQTRHER